MSDFKFCDSCGYKIPATAMFCPMCGQKQEPVQASEPAPQPEMTQQEPVEITQTVAEKQVEESTPAVSEEQAINDIKPEEETVTEPASEPEAASAPVEPEKPVTQQPQITYTPPQPQPQPQPVNLQPQPQQQPNFVQSTPAPAAQQPAAPVKKKKFPWVFTILWLAMLAAVGVWAYFIFVAPNYDYPELTEDAQRFMLFTACVAALIYTLSLKLSVKKLKAIPTIILVLLAMVGFFFFCLVELTDGFLHETVVNIIESISP